MPSRILREGLLTSDRVAVLTGDEERLYTRLLLTVDDFGLCDGRPEIIKAKAFPLHRLVTAEMVPPWLDAIVAANLAERYEVAGKPYLHVFDTRQRRRANTPKFPLPPALVGDPLADDGHVTADGGHPRPRAESEAKSKSKTEAGLKKGELPPLDPHPDFLPDNWGTFEEQRRKSKKPMSAIARDNLVRKLGAWHLQGYDVRAIVQDSIESDWQGLFAKPQHKKKGVGSPSKSAIDEFLNRTRPR